MSLRDYSEVLDIGSIWQTRRRGSLNIVLYITNLDLSSDARKKHVPQVVFSDGQHVLSTSIDRFISRREYIRTDKDVANMLYDALAMPITLKEQSPSFLLDEEADVDDETGIYVGDDEDNYEGPQNFTYDDYYPQTPAAISAHQQEETEKEAESIIEEQPLQDSTKQEASVSITASKQEEEQSVYQEECPVKLFVDDEELTSIIGYSQTMIDSGIVHEIRFSDKDVINKIVDSSAEKYHLALGVMSIDFMPEELINAYAGYDHGHIFYSVMLLEANEDAEDEPMIDEAANAQDDSSLAVDSEVPVNITGSIVQAKELVEEQIEDDQQPIDEQTFDQSDDDIYGDSEDNQVEDEVQAQESSETLETTQEENQTDEMVNESSAEAGGDREDQPAAGELEDETTDAVITEPMVSKAQEEIEVSNEEKPELPQNSDSAIFVYNKQVEENNALADRLEAALNNKEGEEENGSSPNTTTTEERTA